MFTHHTSISPAPAADPAGPATRAELVQYFSELGLLRAIERNPK